MAVGMGRQSGSTVMLTEMKLCWGDGHENGVMLMGTDHGHAGCTLLPGKQCSFSPCCHSMVPQDWHFSPCGIHLVVPKPFQPFPLFDSRALFPELTTCCCAGGFDCSHVCSSLPPGNSKQRLIFPSPLSSPGFGTGAKSFPGR